jgi:hypothetical protein
MMRGPSKKMEHGLPRPEKSKAADASVLAQLAALEAMTVNELKAKWEAIFSTHAPTNSRAYLEMRLSSA